MSFAEVEKPAIRRELGSFEVADIRSLLEQMPDSVWSDHDERKENDFGCFHHTRHLILRFIPLGAMPADAYETPLWSAWRDTLEPILNDIARSRYGYERYTFPKVMFARLQAGEVIDRHCDGRGSNLVSHKIHIPIVTDPAVIMDISTESFHLELGVAYEVNNIVSHAVTNGSDEDRIHLIFELHPLPE